MAGTEVAELVGQHRLELLGRQCVHQRKTDGEVVPVPPQHAEPGHLNDSGVHVLREHHLMQLRSATPDADLLHGVIELRCLLIAEDPPLGCRDLHPHRPHDQRGKDQQQDAESQFQCRR